MGLHVVDDDHEASVQVRRGHMWWHGGLGWGTPGHFFNPLLSVIASGSDSSVDYKAKDSDSLERDSKRKQEE